MIYKGAVLRGYIQDHPVDQVSPMLLTTPEIAMKQSSFKVFRMIAFADLFRWLVRTRVTKARWATFRIKFSNDMNNVGISTELSGKVTGESFSGLHWCLAT